MVWNWFVVVLHTGARAAAAGGYTHWVRIDRLHTKCVRAPSSKHAYDGQQADSPAADRLREQLCYYSMLRSPVQSDLGVRLVRQRPAGPGRQASAAECQWPGRLLRSVLDETARDYPEGCVQR